MELIKIKGIISEARPKAKAKPKKNASYPPTALGLEKNKAKPKAKPQPKEAPKIIINKKLLDITKINHLKERRKSHEEKSLREDTAKGQKAAQNKGSLIKI